MVDILTEESLHQKTPQELTSILYRACLDKLDQAIRAIRQKQYVHSNLYLQGCCDILRRLGAGLNYEAGIIADQLELIYSYMVERLIHTIRNRDVEAAIEVRALLKDIADAWELASNTNTDKKSNVLKRKTRAYDHDLYVGTPTVNRKE